MDRAAALERVESDGRRLLAVVDDLDASVPTCPDWSVHDLVSHIGWVHRNVTEHVRRRAAERVPPGEIEAPPAGDAVVRYAESALDGMLEALGAVEPSEPMWSWAERHDAGFFIRRMVHETAVHRFDAESVSGVMTPIDDDWGADGVDELYDTVLVYSLRHSPRPLPAATLHLHRTDGGDGEWMLRAVDGVVELGHGHEKGDAALRGAGGELFLAVWGRLPLADLEVFGDAAAAQAWIDLSP